jgi:FtsH-binding integral membrane protein
MPDLTVKGPETTMQPTAFDEASRQTYGRWYWFITAALVLATIAAWLWGEQWMRTALGVVALVFILVVGIVNHVRMNRIVRQRERQGGSGGGSGDGSDVR